MQVKLKVNIEVVVLLCLVKIFPVPNLVSAVQDL